jgi:CRISPR-associated protein Cas1
VFVFGHRFLFRQFKKSSFHCKYNAVAPGNFAASRSAENKPHHTMTQLILNQRGSSLSVHNGRYRIRSKEREFYIPVHEVKSICLHAATRLSHEVVMTAIEHNTDVLFVDRKGFPVGRLWSHHFGSIATIRKHQLQFAQSRTGIEWIRSVLIRKLGNQRTVVDLLAALGNVGRVDESTPDYEETLHTLARYQEKIRQVSTDDASECFATFRGLEGSASRAYFAQINRFLPEQYRFAKRAHRGATDAFNCLLNYAYGMLYGQCESALIQVGIDPFVGVMHRDEYNRPVLVYDFIELFRAWADYVVCHLLMQEVVFDEFFDRSGDPGEPGNYWLNTTGKRILIQSMNDYLAEIVAIGGLSRSRGQHLILEAQKLATTLKTLTVQP